MKRITAVIIICLIFSIFMACGDAGVLVHHKTVSPETMEAMCQECNGFSEWHLNDDAQQYDQCTIYVMPITEYVDVDEYHRVLGHEYRHCIEGYHHPETP